MRKLALLFALFMFIGGFVGPWALGDAAPTPTVALPWPAGLPRYDHVVIVVEENKDYDQIIGNPSAPYINDVLKKEGANFTRDVQNRIATIFAGAHIKPGDYPEGKGITHVNILRTIEAMYGLPRAGAQQPTASGGGIGDDYIITDIFANVR